MNDEEINSKISKILRVYGTADYGKATCTEGLPYELRIGNIMLRMREVLGVLTNFEGLVNGTRAYKSKTEGVLFSGEKDRERLPALQDFLRQEWLDFSDDNLLVNGRENTTIIR